MSKSRLEAFSDGVIAIIITIMVLEIKAPHEASTNALVALWPKFLSYMLSFVMAGIYWNNHHHMLHAAQRVNGRMLWANLHLLFWLSLIPFTTAWMGENGFAPLPTAAYGFVLLMSGGAYPILQAAIIAHHGPGSKLAKAVGSGHKEKLSLTLYAAAIPLAFVHQAISLTIYVVVALLWLIPDKRIESALES